MSHSLVKNPSKHQSLLIAVVSLTAAYLIGSQALDTGSLWQYFVSFVLVLMSIRHFVRIVKKDQRGKSK